jgi:four helix bundle protein
METAGVDEKEFKDRTKKFALWVIKMVKSLPNDHAADVLGKQLLRSATSVAANYRAACRAKSRADMIHKLSIVEEEADESLLWMELLAVSNLITASRLSALMAEGNEILAMTVASIKTLRTRK